MPKKGTKSAKKASRAIKKEMHKHPGRSRAQNVAVGLNRARKAGARIPKKRGK